MKHLTLEQRYEIDINYRYGMSMTKIAQLIGKSTSTISREIARNSELATKEYRAIFANTKAIKRHEEKDKNIRLNDKVKNSIDFYLKKKYSPEQIVGSFELKQKEMVSTEAIYQYIWKDKRTGGKLFKNLRRKGKKYVKRGNKNIGRGMITNRVDIDQRPAIVEEKKRFGDLEIDLIIGKNNTGNLLTINDRKTGILFMSKVESKQATEIESKCIELLRDWKPLIKTITSDNGKEFANHEAISKALTIDFYFAKPYHSWERGANENLNGLVRQYFPKGMEFTSITNEEINRTVNELNNRPRKRFGFYTPNEILKQNLNANACVAFTS